MQTNQIALLREIVERRCPTLMPLVDCLEYRQLTQEERRRLQDVVSSELADTGFLGDDLSNARGSQLEEIIDSLASWK